MSDPLSVVASITGLIAISAKIVSRLKDLRDCGMRAKQAPESLKQLMEEMQDMNVIFCQAQQLITGTTKIPNESRLKMLSIEVLVATLSGCVLVISNLDKYLSKVMGIDDPRSIQSPAKKTSLLFKRVKWAMWKEAEVAVFFEDLQRLKLSWILMLSIIQCRITAEAAENLQKLHEVVFQITESNHAVSIRLQELLNTPYPAISDETKSPTVDIQPEATKLPPSSLDELEGSRPYKRFQKWGMSDDSYSTFSNNSSETKASNTSFTIDVHSHTTPDAAETNESLHATVSQISECSRAMLSQLRDLLSRYDPSTSDKIGSPISDEIESPTVDLQPEAAKLPSFLDELEGSRPYERFQKWADVHSHAMSDAAETIERLHATASQILESNRAVSIQLRDLLSRCDPSTSDKIGSPISDEIESPTADLQPEAAKLPPFLDELEGSRPYKRFQKRGMSNDACSIFSNNSSETKVSNTSFTIDLVKYQNPTVQS
ncbi:hypothetical protein BDZ91DRAFT_163825 [Kalaharituber pfeilii]|nr:hypothetical protein BDZ91DRAFT_163825 [Kalaharituber pfeilii]